MEAVIFKIMTRQDNIKMCRRKTDIERETWIEQGLGGAHTGISAV